MRASNDVERLDASVREAKMWLRVFRCRMKRVVREAEHLRRLLRQTLNEN